MRVISLASGSNGNACLVGSDEGWLLIDDGLPYEALSRRLRCVGAKPSGVLITHAHEDHVAGLRALWNRERCPVYANAGTMDAIKYAYGIPDEAFVCFENGQHFDVAAFDVVAFPIPHDDSDPVGYLVKTDETYFHGTDIGTPLPSIGGYIAQADVATIESNHDTVMLHASGRPHALVTRIHGQRGHLSNEQASDFVCQYASVKLKRLGLAHLSHSCNDAALAANNMRVKLMERGRPDVTVSAFRQNEVVEI